MFLGFWLLSDDVKRPLFRCVFGQPVGVEHAEARGPALEWFDTVEFGELRDELWFLCFCLVHAKEVG